MAERIRAASDLALPTGAIARSGKRASFETVAPRVLLYLVIGFFAFPARTVICRDRRSLGTLSNTYLRLER